MQTRESKSAVDLKILREGETAPLTEIEHDLSQNYQHFCEQ